MKTPSTGGKRSPEYFEDFLEERRSDAQTRTRSRADLLIGICIVGFYAVWRASVAYPTGQAMEQMAFVGSRIGARFVSAQALGLLQVVSVPAAIGLVLVVLVGALWRGSRRRALWAAGTVVAINVSTQVIKYLVLSRPDFGFSQKFGGANTLPSGHTAVAASAAVALILVSTPRWRPAAAWAGAVLAAAMGYATLVCQWHRPGDVLAALLLATCWGGVAITFGAWADEPRRGDADVWTRIRQYQPENSFFSVVVLGGLAVFAGVNALVFEVITWRNVVDVGGVAAVAAGQITRDSAFLAYAAGAFGTVGMAGMGMASLALLTPREE
ncbi:phosphatase PAP2 family protein [Actinomyces sp.]|uniref:phosphatase PAP2 family protein n=1 Tax=Actinomyces sp. TaxID=29317 RepID=UPI0026DCDE93|nr:phosphatase PAP2 family protein [Actinomyces sp.]MDO4901007.1 phosphatase PAP2 family protein [Actinomyces sp.]